MILIENDRRYLHQWALDQRVQIDNFLPGTWVEFSLRDDSKCIALITEAYEETGHVFANIPNVLLQSFGFLRVCVSPPATDMVHTPEEKDFKIVRRAKPSHYIYTETPTVSYESKVNLFWGVDNAGKALVVGDDGYVKASGNTVDDSVATDDEVDDMFDNVFGENEGTENPGGETPEGGNTDNPGNENTGGDNAGDNENNDDNIATDEEVDDMFGDVFG